MASSMDWANPPAPSSTPPSQQLQQQQQYRAPYPPGMALRPNQPPMGMPYHQQRPAQPGMYQPPYPPQGAAYPAQFMQYPGQPNSAPGMPQGYLPAANARASDWQEHIAPDGRRYYYHKRDKVSSWEKPLELMSSTERADASTVWKEITTQDNKKYYYNKLTNKSTWTMPEEMRLAREQASLGIAVVPRPETTPAVAVPSASPAPSVSPAPAQGSNLQVPNTAAAVPGTSPATASFQENVGDGVEDASHDVEDAKQQEAASAAKVFTPEEKPAVIEEPLYYATKQEAKTAFKELLEAYHVQSDWTWDQTMRMIINDKRYGAVKTLGERKQAFNEYLAQRKKLDAEEKRTKQKKAREDFTKMLEESKELTSSMRWSKVYTMFEGDPRYLALEKERDREDLFDDYLTDLERRERDKAREEKKKNRAEFKDYLQSCDFIKPNTQWRKVQERLEEDERYTRLEKLDRLEVFLEYMRDLEKHEDEEKKLQREQLRRKERKNRDEFRGLLEMHKGTGVLVARTTWTTYCAKVKDHPAYQAVAANASGSTPKELFMDAIEELEKQYQEDKARIKDVMKAGKIAVVSTTTYDEFKASILEAGELGTTTECNIKFAFEDLMERIKEKEEKEAKKRRRLADDFNSLLRSTKSLTVTANWEEAKAALEESAEYKAMGDETLLKKLFEEHLVYLQQKSKDKERKRDKDEKSKSKDKDDRRKSGSKKESEEVDAGHKDEKKKDRDKKHKRRHRSGSSEENASDKEDESKKSKRHSHKSSRKHHDSDSDAEPRPKRHRRDRKATAEELEDGEVGEDGEIR